MSKFTDEELVEKARKLLWDSVEKIALKGNRCNLMEFAFRVGDEIPDKAKLMSKEFGLTIGKAERLLMTANRQISPHIGGFLSDIGWIKG